MDPARDAFQRVAARPFEDHPRTVDWPACLALLGWTCAWLGDAVRAPALYELLAPHAELLIIVGVTPAVCAGSFHHPLGALAAVMDRPQAAEAHLQAAVERNEAIGARPWAARARLDLARLRVDPGPGGRHDGRR